MLRVFNLQNGIKVASYSIPEMNSVFISAAVKAGWVFDKEKTSGVAHFMEHLLVQGIPSFPTVEDLSTYIEALAGNYNASTGPDLVDFYISAPAGYLEDLLKITAEVLYEPLFPESALERERNAVLEEIRQRQSSSWYKNSKFFSNTRFNKNHPYRKLDGGGSVEGVSIIKRNDLIDYWSKFFFPKNTYITVVGGFTPAKLEELLAKIFSKYTNRKAFIGYPDITNRDLSNRTVSIREDREYKTCYVDISIPSIWEGLPVKEYLPQSLILSLLTNLRTSRLSRELRQRRGLVYGISSSSPSLNSFGYIDIQTQVIEENLEEVLQIIFEELSVVVKNGITKEELEFAKNYRINQFMMRFDHPMGIANTIENDLLWSEKIYTPKEFTPLVEQITLKDITNFINKYWDFKKLNVIVQGPLKNSKKNREKISKIAGII